MEALVLASRLFKIAWWDPYDPRPSGLRRLFAALGLIGLVFIGLQSAADNRPAGYGLTETAFASPEPLQ